MSRINRVLIMGALLLACSAMAAQAFTEAPSSWLGRLNTLGGGDMFNAYYWADSEEVTYFPGSLTNYSNIATLSFSPGAPGASGFTLAKAEETFGTYYLGLHMSPNAGGGGQEWNNTTLGYGYSLEAMNIGFLWTRQGVSDTTGGTEISESWNNFALGVDYELNEDTNIDASFQMRSGSTDGLLATDPAFVDASGFSFLARAFYAWREDVTVVPVVNFASMEAPTSDTKMTAMGVGLGFAYTVNESNDLVMGLNYQNNKIEPTGGTDVTTNTMPGFYIGTQHEFTDWLELRAAATKSWNKTEMGAGTEMTAYPFGFALGAGVAIGDWQVDMGLNTGWLYNVGYWFHGNAGTTGAPVASLQAKLFF